MRHIRRTFGIRYKISVVLFLAALCTGCIEQSIDPRSLSFWKPHLLYLQSAPCKSLYVEIDAVEGSAPNEETIETLRRCLQRHCDKSGEIQIVCNTPIPLEDAQSTRPELLALRYMDGPTNPEHDGSTAYLYVLYYDSSKLLGKKYRQAVNPHAKLLPYPAAIYMDTRYIEKHHLSKHEAQLLLHEVGHILGLTWSQKRGHDWYCHCRDKSCLMNESYRVPILPFQKEQHKEFCDLCIEDIEAAGTEETDPKLKFIGPVMVRSEEDYHVLSLPAFVKLHFGPLELIKWQEVLEQARNETPRRAPQADAAAVIMDSGDPANFNEILSLHRAIENAERDPCHTVRLGVNIIKEQLMKQSGPISNTEQTVSKWLFR